LSTNYVPEELSLRSRTRILFKCISVCTKKPKTKTQKTKTKKKNTNKLPNLMGSTSDCGEATLP